MRFHRFALYTAAFLALNSFQSHNKFALAEEETATPEPVVEEAVGDKFEFEADVSRVLDIVVNSLYQNKDVFLRELISNASDALDKIRFLSITKPELLADKAELEIRLAYDGEAKTLTITDSGIGMTKDELVKNLGTVANSGTTKFMDSLADGAADVSQIGMFGVGFYSSFLVAEKVTVASKSPSDEQYIWSSSNGSSAFSVGEDPRGNTLGRGTEITLHLKEDAEEYAGFDKLADMVHHYSEFITHPIFVRKEEKMEVPDEDEDVVDEDKEEGDEDELDVTEDEDSDEEKPQKMKEVTTYDWVKSNADAAIWTRSKDDISDDEYQQFFKLINKESYKNATSWSHFDAEGNINFRSLIYMPDEIPRELERGDVTQFSNRMKLYVRKVLISDEFELLPKYMSFITGVVDSDDLPLNVNRETLQESKIIAIIRKKVTRKVIDMIKKFAESKIETEEEEKEVEIDADGNVIETEDEDKEVKEEKEHPYLDWYRKFQPSIKMGVVEDDANRKRLAKLIRFKTSKSDGKWISFDKYVENMKDWQDQIFYISGTELTELEKSPFMEKFNAKDVEVIYFTEPADDYMIQHLREFDSKKITTITHESIKFGDDDADLEKRIEKAYKNKYDSLITFMNKFYGRSVSKVIISRRLESVPSIVSSGEYGNTANMERIMRAQAFAHGENNVNVNGPKTLEINPRHPFIESLLSKVPEGEDERPPIEVRDSLWNLLDTGLLNGGYQINEGKAFTMRMMRSIKSNLGVESVELLPEIEPAEEEDEPPEAMGGDGINMDDFDIDIDSEMDNKGPHVTFGNTPDAPKVKLVEVDPKDAPPLPGDGMREEDE